MRDARRRVAAVLASAAALLLAGSAVRASIIPLDPVRTGTGPYTWSYAANLSVNSTINDTGKDYFILYDFTGYVPNSVFAPAGWVATAELTTAPPAGVALLMPDDPAVENLKFVYMGPTVVNNDPVNGINLGLFGAQSTQSDKTFDLSAYQNHDNTDPTGTMAVGQNVAIVPFPEPASLGLLSLGALAMLARRR